MGDHENDDDILERVGADKITIRRCIICDDPIEAGAGIRPGNARDWFHHSCYQRCLKPPSHTDKG